MVGIEDRIEDVERLEQAYQDLIQLDERYDTDFSEALNLLDDVLSEEPDQSATMSYRQAYIKLENTDNSQLDAEDRSVLTGIKHALNEERESFPATGTDRHYSLDERRKNL